MSVDSCKNIHKMFIELTPDQRNTRFSFSLWKEIFVVISKLRDKMKYPDGKAPKTLKSRVGIHKTS